MKRKILRTSGHHFAGTHGVAAKALLLDAEFRAAILVRSQAELRYGGPTMDLPGGRLEPSESVIPGLCREVQEETGLELAHSDPLLLGHWEFIDDRNGLRVIGLTFASRILATSQGPTSLSPEHTSMSWRTLEEIEELDLGEQISPVMISRVRALLDL